MVWFQDVPSKQRKSICEPPIRRLPVTPQERYRVECPKDSDVLRFRDKKYNKKWHANCDCPWQAMGRCRITIHQVEPNPKDNGNDTGSKQNRMSCSPVLNPGLGFFSQEVQPISMRPTNKTRRRQQNIKIICTVGFVGNMSCLSISHQQHLTSCSPCCIWDVPTNLQVCSLSFGHGSSFPKGLKAGEVDRLRPERGSERGASERVRGRFEQQTWLTQNKKAHGGY